MLILSNYCTTWIPEKGHICSQGTTKQTSRPSGGPRPRTMYKVNKPAMQGSLGKDKMSKGARNVDIGHFDITQPPERVKKNGSHGPE